LTTAVIFDLEDTLVETPWSQGDRIVEFRKATRVKLIQLGIPRFVLEGIERSTIMRNKAAEYAQNHFTEKQRQQFHSEIDQFVKTYELEAARKSRLFPDTISTLDELGRLGVPVGLVTNTSREAANIEFRTHEIGHYFKSIVTRERVAKLKPDPEGILLAAEELNATRVFMVGDLRIDLEAARAAHAVCILVKRSHGDGLNLNPDYYVDSLAEVPSIVQAATRGPPDAKHSEG